MSEQKEERTHRLALRAYRQREAVLLAFRDLLPPECERLRNLSAREWQRLLRWLDTSGLAVYFLDRLTQVEVSEMLPREVLARLQRNLLDNTARTDAMIAEFSAIHNDFQRAGLSYATLKGFSLWPLSVPRLELRSQLDLDFLIAEKSAVKARQILEAMGYRLCAISGPSWEFRANRERAYTDLYQPTPHRCVELHLEAASAGSTGRLSRVDVRFFQNIYMPVLSPVDLFLGQGLHISKHVLSDFVRTAHLIEFRRHILARHHDDKFWDQLREHAESSPSAAIGLGLATLLIARAMGDFAPEALTCWTVDRLPATARLWVDLYGSRTVYGDPPGNKLHLLLKREMEAAGATPKRPLRQALLPLTLPKTIAQATAGETVEARAMRYRRQLHFIQYRLRFHLVEGVRYLLESIRWRRQLRRIGEGDPSACSSGRLPKGEVTDRTVRPPQVRVRR